MHADRLIKLAELLEADAINPKGIKFDLGVWGEAETGSAVSLSCGTHACAMGLAVLSGAFDEFGLFNRGRSGDDTSLIIPAIMGKDFMVTGYQAAGKLFEILHGEACHLFSPDSYDLTKGADAELDVATRIREFVADRQPEEVAG